MKSNQLENQEKRVKVGIDGWIKMENQIYYLFNLYQHSFHRLGYPGTLPLTLISLKDTFYNRLKCTESKAEEKSVLEQYGLVNDLIEEIKALTLDYPDRKPQLINAIEQLNVMKAKRLGE